eukprot:GAFH01001535.1.p2 GENE.GAFH01001535.1~~GAFH01001535.1.p2  ORF type:complete len:248 (+),score=68.09 GAFH01001535.1:531-1274(+)
MVRFDHAIGVEPHHLGALMAAIRQRTPHPLRFVAEVNLVGIREDALWTLAPTVAELIRQDGHHPPGALMTISTRCFEQVRALYQALGIEYFFDFNFREAAVRHVAAAELHRPVPAVPLPPAGCIAFLDNHDVDRFAMAVAYRMACLQAGVEELDWETPKQRDSITGVQLSGDQYARIMKEGLRLLQHAAAQGASVLAYQGDEYPDCPHLQQSLLWLAAERTEGWGDLRFRQCMRWPGEEALRWTARY